jgi:hypothetical protein
MLSPTVPCTVSVLALDPHEDARELDQHLNYIQRFGGLAILYDHKTINESAQTRGEGSKWEILFLKILTLVVLVVDSTA